MDESCFIDVSKQYMASFYRMAYSIVGNQQDAEDAVQQALLNAWRSRHHAREGAERAYIMRIVMNESYSILRRRKRTMLLDELNQLSAESVCPHSSELYEAIYALPVKLRSPFLLKYMEDMSEKEVAMTLKLPLSSVKNRLFRARKHLRQSLKEEETL